MNTGASSSTMLGSSRRAAYKDRGSISMKFFTMVVRMELVHLILAMAAHEGWRVHHMDVKSAFLNDDLAKEVYVQQP
jgi:hypothetical protein